MSLPPLRTFQCENFKAIRETRSVKFGWLTAFIGNNGVGKSSLIEALETFRDVSMSGVDAAFSRWRGFEHVVHKGPERRLLPDEKIRSRFTSPLEWHFTWRHNGHQMIGHQIINQGPGGNSLFIQSESLIARQNGEHFRVERTDKGQVRYFPKTTEKTSKLQKPDLADGESIFSRFGKDVFSAWQFLTLNPDRMGQPVPQQRAANQVRLARDGSNVAEYLNEIRRLDLQAFESLLEALRFVLPYASDLQPILTSELERSFYLRLKENTYDVPGWLLSTSTLRIVALLACLRHPTPPPLLVIEEIENGLDPRTLHLVVEEIRAAITAGTTQVILTTHAPYLLDLLDLSHIVVVERENGQPVFHRPDVKELAKWATDFSPGRLYTMGRLTKEDR